MKNTIKYFLISIIFIACGSNSNSDNSNNNKMKINFPYKVSQDTIIKKTSSDANISISINYDTNITYAVLLSGSATISE